VDPLVGTEHVRHSVHGPPLIFGGDVGKEEAVVKHRYRFLSIWWIRVDVLLHRLGSYGAETGLSTPVAKLNSEFAKVSVQPY
jgi:hypothetical protein